MPHRGLVIPWRVVTCWEQPYPTGAPGQGRSVMLSGLGCHYTDTTPSAVLAYAEGGPPAPQPEWDLLDLTFGITRQQV